MMNLVSRCSVRDPNVLASNASESPEKTRHESQFPLSSRIEQHQRTGRPVEDAYSSSYSEWNVDKTWSSHGNLMNWWKLEQGDLFYSHSTRTDSLLKTIIWILTPKQNQTCRSNPDHSCTGWMIKCERGWTNPQKMRRKTATNTLWYGECLCLLHCKHLYSWERITQTIYIPSKKKTEDLTVKQMFDKS